MHRIVPSASSRAGRRALMDAVCFSLEFVRELKRNFERDGSSIGDA